MLKTKLRAGLTALTLIVLALVSTTAHAASAAPPLVIETRAPVIETRAPSLHPEGVAWDPLRHAFLVGSVRHGTVSVVRLDGSVRTLVDDGVMVSVIGVHVDAHRRRILVAYQDPGVGVRSSDATRLRQSGVGIFDLRSGALLHRVDLTAVPGAAEHVHGANDLAIDSNGNAYVTDIASGEIYRVGRDGTATLLLRDERLGRDGVGPNGIVWHPDGYLLVVRYDTGVLWRIPVQEPAQMTEVHLGTTLVGGDGMVLQPDRSLAVMTNHLASAAISGVSVLRSSDGWASAVATVRPWPQPEQNPTTATVTPLGTYVLEGRLGSLFAGTPLDDFTLRPLC
ncbi:SMP-30/gluconolactonase/LRE family protein [Micromonospora sp. NPDC003197]